jgi:phospho-N-acetylmuramoyl-pentapeptide-transferase
MTFVPVLIKLFFLAGTAFLIGIILTPILTYFLYKYKFGQQIKDRAITGEKAKIYAKLHKAKAFTPTGGGIIIWVSVAIVTLLFNLSRAETWLPLATLVASGVLGFVDDILNVFSVGLKKGLGFLQKFGLQMIIAIVGAWWFYYKLGFSSIHVPGVGNFNIGWLYIPLFIIVIIATTNAVNITDGLDGLAGGCLLTSFAAYVVIAFIQGHIGIAAFCCTIVGALLAFLWFNIYPARFFMGDTGSLALGATLGVIAMLTNTVLVLPIIGFVFVVETLSVIVQILSKKLRHGKKIFRSAPLHHHLEAIGWPEPKIVMRLWIISGVFAILGLIIALIGRG